MKSSGNKNRFRAMTCSSWKLAYTNEKSNKTNTVIKKDYMLYQKDSTGDKF